MAKTSPIFLVMLAYLNFNLSRRSYFIHSFKFFLAIGRASGSLLQLVNKHPPAKPAVFHAGKAICSSQMRKTHNMVCQPRSDCCLPPVNRPSSIIAGCLLNSFLQLLRNAFGYAAGKIARRIRAVPAAPELPALIFVFSLPPIFHIHFVYDRLFISFRCIRMAILLPQSSPSHTSNAWFYYIIKNRLKRLFIFGDL